MIGYMPSLVEKTGSLYLPVLRKGFSNMHIGLTDVELAIVTYTKTGY